MFHIKTGIFGAASALVTLGVMQFAFGSDLHGMRDDASGFVNRAAKSDRANMARGLHPGRTVAFSLAGLPDTTVLTRIQAVVETPRASQPSRMPVACELPVSVLSDLARVLTPARCVT